MLVLNLVSMILGPSSVALFTEKVYGGPEHVGLGIATTFAILGPLSGLIFAIGMRPARRALAANGEG